MTPAPSATEPCPPFAPTPLNILGTDLEIVACINAGQWERVTELQALANRLRREARHAAH